MSAETFQPIIDAMHDATNGEAWIDIREAGVVRLDGEFKAEELEAIAKLLRGA